MYTTYFVSRSELADALQGPGSSIEDVVFAAGSYNFDHVLAVWVG